MSDNQKNILELAGLWAILILFNYPILSGDYLRAGIFLPEQVAAGQWWRVFTYHFVHLTWWHFLFDAGAFVILYRGLAQTSQWKKMSYVAVCGLGSLVFGMLAIPGSGAEGLCGLSGTAHGLMAISGLECMTARDSDPVVKRVGFVCFALVVIKSMWEAVAGKVLLEIFFFGMMGVPLALCHAGGTLTGILVFVFASRGGFKIFSLPRPPLLMHTSVI